MLRTGFIIPLVLVFIFSSHEAANDDREVYCAACEVIFDEIIYSISKIDAKKTIEIEGFRVDPQGNQRSRSIPYARSEVHLTEVTENLCSNMNKYAHTRDELTKQLKFIRTESRNGEAITLENVSMSGEISERLRYVCENIIEEHEEDIINYFKQDQKDSLNHFCSKVTKLCSESNEVNDEL